LFVLVQEILQETEPDLTSSFSRAVTLKSSSWRKMELKKRLIALFPLDRLVRWYLRSSGKEYLIRFLDGLAHLGRPSSVFFPPELFEQGLSLVLSGLNNTLSIQSNPHWVWPYWVERQQDPEGAEFVPTGVNLVMGNLTRRNWTSIGIRGSRQEAMVDPVGMVTLEPFGWSLLPFLKRQGQSFVPPRLEKQAVQRLKGENQPTVITEYRTNPDLLWEFEAQALLTHGEEMVALTQRVKNQGTDPITLTLGFALRPYNPLTIGHINKIKYKNRLWRINRRPALLVLNEPDRILASTGERIDPLLQQGDLPQIGQLRSKTGLLMGQAEFDLVLEPGEEKEICAVAPVAKRDLGPERRFAHLDLPTLEKARSASEGFWRQNLLRGLQLQFPEPALQTAFEAVKNHLHVFDDQDRFTAGTFFYHFHWLRDSAFLALAFENLGWTVEVAAKVPGYLQLQTKEGFFRSQDGEWDGAGQALLTLVRHFLRKGDKEGLKANFAALYKGALWIEKTRNLTNEGQAPHAGMLPAGISAEHFGPNDHYFWDNFWALAGLKALARAAQWLGKTKEEGLLKEEATLYQERLSQIIAIAVSETPQKGLPCSPYRPLDTAAIGNLVALYPLDLVSPFEPWVGPTLDYLWENNLRQGLFYQKIIHTGLNAYLSAQLAQAFLARGDERVWVILEALLEKGGPTHVWPEAIHPRTQGGCMGDGDHGWAAAEFVNLCRNLCVKEQQGELLLGLGLRPQWFTGEQTLTVTEAPTDFGTLSYGLKVSFDQIEVQWEQRPGPAVRAARVFLVLPQNIVEGPKWGVSKVRIALEGTQGVLRLERIGPSAPFQSQSSQPKVS